MRGLFNGKTVSHLEIALYFLVYRNFQLPPSRVIPSSPLPPPPLPGYLILPNVPTHRLVRTTTLYSGPKSAFCRKRK